jgi:hypothetical protein
MTSIPGCSCWAAPDRLRQTQPRSPPACRSRSLPGTYVLVNDLPNCSFVGIQVQARNMRLLLNKHTISGGAVFGFSADEVKCLRIVGGTITASIV